MKKTARTKKAGEDLTRLVVRALTALFSDVSEVAVENLREDEPLGTYGIDSLMITRLNQRLSDVIEGIPSTLFFDHGTLRDVAGFLVAARPDDCAAWVGANPRQRVSRAARAGAAGASDGTGTASKPVPSPAANRRQARPKGRVASQTDVAIIGMAGRFPQAETLDQFWDNLRTGRDCIGEIPDDRWSLEGFFDPDKERAIAAGKSYAKWVGSLEGFADFDPLFFNISPNDAINMDPQERLFLHAAWEVLEDAGYTRATLAERYEGRVGVFAGVARPGFNLYTGVFSDTSFQPNTSFAGVANRVSYFLNLHGPSMSVDTLCSASLTAVHEAYAHVSQGACDMAIAGGVNLFLHPNNYVRLCALRMLSVDGRCKAFGEGANGIVPGEGVAAILLKPLDRALAEGDHVYAVIRGSSVNHGGRTNGYTVPNPAAQRDLVAAALDSAGVDARSIGYVEAHGTGTVLGDPIEISGLTGAFRRHTAENGFCAIGSVKTNIGHLEAAAGIAGLVKVVLQLGHRQLAPSLHAQSLNPRITFEQTPFVVQRELAEWPALLDRRGREQPRRAGVSSFGAGGANAHVILEEFVDERAQREGEARSSAPAIVVLSARSVDQLRAAATRLLDWIKRRAPEDSALPDLAYTLQIGREAFDQRLALEVRSIDELGAKLRVFVDGGAPAPGVHCGEVKWASGGAKASGGAHSDGELDGNASQIAQQWVAGGTVDWMRLHSGRQPRRMSLPTYAFAKSKLWIPQEEAAPRDSLASRRATRVGRSALHPLLQENTSDLMEQRFSSTFDGTERLLANHVVRGRRTLPAVSFLEMLHAAISRALPGRQCDGSTALRVTRHRWLQPVQVADTPVTVRLGMTLDGEDDVEYAFYSEHAGRTGALTEETLYAEGRVSLSEEGADPAAIAIDDLRELCRGMIDADRCYDYFAARGVERGSACRALAGLWFGEQPDGRRFVLARLALPEALSSAAAEYQLHPAVLDAAVAAAVGLHHEQVLAGDAPSDAPELPYELQRLGVFRPTPHQGWAYVRPSDGTAAADPGRGIDIDICDDEGRVCVRLAGFSERAIEPSPASAGAPALLAPRWEPCAPSSRNGMTGDRFIVMAGLPTRMRTAVIDQFPAARVVSLDADIDDEPVPARVEKSAVALLTLVQEHVRRDPARAARLQLIVPSRGEHALFAALSGELATAHREYPALTYQVVLLAEHDTSADVRALLDASDRADSVVSIGNGVVHARRWVAAAEDSRDPPWKPTGAYLITGGAGGLGLVVAEEIARQVPTASIWLTGRSPLSPDKASRLAALSDRGVRVEYREADVADEAAMARLREELEQSAVPLRGIVHAAGVLHDRLLVRKSPDELRAVLRPKVAGVVVLDRVFRELDLDFFALFSSVNALAGNVGQVDYATANAFLDAFAVYRNEQVALGERRGRAVSINWPAWSEGMRVVGVEPTAARSTPSLSRALGIEALYRALGSGLDRVAIVNGDTESWRRLVERVDAASESRPASADAAPDAVEQLVPQLVETMAVQLKARAEDLDLDTELSEFGFDSISLTNLTNRLNERYALDLRPTLFFEHATIRRVAVHLVGSYGQQLAARLGAERSGPAAAGPTPEASAPPPSAAVSAARRRGRRRARGASAPEPIAIVGRAGRFPGAADLDDFWANLRDGVDSIGDIPADRWDWRKLYGNPQKEPNKTNVKSGGFIDGLDEFDPLFFRMSPREANLLDPRQRLLMTYIWRAIEDAGYAPSSLSGSRTAIFVGMLAQQQVDSSPDPDGASTEGYGALRNMGSLAPNRVSYFLNLRGPSEPIETACSSGLVAIHRAALALRHEACDMVIAGGVNAILYPTGHISLSKAGMLSPDGRCKAFAATADGYGRGEGIGLVVLKRLGDAERDGDHIYAVIRGSAVNHGGRGTSLTAPNPAAQAEVVRMAYTQAALDPRTISYIEAHGTGTPLGDPIEIEGLVRAFDDPGAARKDSAVGAPRCAIGSVKSNIGHLEMAAGVAGLMKILLQLQHRTIARSLHCDVLNPHVRLDGTPFFIARETMPWASLVDADGGVLPRRAGVSSFGVGGVNAHVVVEEYVSPEQPARVPASTQRPALIVLSARSEPKLREQADQLLTAVRTRHFDDLDLPSIAYTLQVGRDAFDHRLAWRVSSIAELERTLEQAIAGASGPALIHRGRKSAERAGDKRAHESVASWIASGDIDKVLDAWVSGVAVDWRALYGSAPPRRMSLPTYPFARERYALCTSPASRSAARDKPTPQHSGSARPATAPHPLVQTNTSDLTGQRFTSVFDGHEWFLADRVGGGRVLTPAAYIEMIRAAIAAAVPAAVIDSGLLRMRLSHHAWLQPLQAGPAAATVHVGLQLAEGGEIAYSVYSTGNSRDDEEVAHAEGRALLRGATENALTVDVDALRSRCDRSADAGNALVGRRAGWLAGAVEAAYSGRDAQGSRFVLARITVPETLEAAHDMLCVHPVLLGAAMEMGVELLRAAPYRSRDPAPNLLALPGTVDEIAILGPVPPRAWAYVRLAAANGAGPSAVNLDVCDDAGGVALRFRGWELGSSTDRSFAAWDRSVASSAAGARPGNH